MSHEGCAIKITRYNPTLTITALAVGVLAGANAVHAQIPCGYEVQIIQGPWCNDIFEFPPTFPTDINEAGHVIGYYWPCDIGPATPFRWTPEQEFVTLPMPPGAQEAWPWGLNDQGDIVGTFENADNDFRAFVYIDGEYTELPPIPQDGWSQGFAINNIRQVVGYRSILEDVTPYNGFLWQDNDFLDLGIVKGPNSSALGVNQIGDIAGWTGTSVTTSDTRAVVWQDGRPIVLGVLPEGINSFAVALNTSGKVAGTSKLSDDPATIFHAFLWDNGKMDDLGTLPDFDRSAATDLNDTSKVVGICSQSVGPSEQVAFLWDEGVMTELHDLVDPQIGVSLRRAQAINNNDQILVDGTDRNGNVVALLLEPSFGPTGDLNEDCSVTAIDLLILLVNWGQCDSCVDCIADLDGDCSVGASDLLILLSNWG